MSLLKTLKAEVKFREGQKFYRTHDYKKAEEAFKKVISLNNKYAGGFLYLSIILDKEEKFEEGETAIKKALELSPMNPAYFIFLGVHYYNCRNHVEAERAFKQCLEIEPKNQLARNYTGLIYLKEGRYREAIDIFHKHWLTQNDAFLAQLLFEIGKFISKKTSYAPSAAVSESEEALRNSKGFFERFINKFKTSLLMEKGKILMEKKRYQEALDLYKKALKLSPAFYRGRLFMGEAYFYLKQYDEAERNFQISLNRDGQDELLYYYLYYLGNINYYKGNFAEAEEQLRDAGKLYPGFAEASYSLALICLKTGREKEALEFFEHAVREDPAIAKMKLKEFEDYISQENLQEAKDSS